MKKVKDPIKIDKGKTPKRKRRSTYPFDDMKPGDSFTYEGHRSTAAVSFGSYLAAGLYSTEPIGTDGKHWRFHLIKPIPKKE